VVAQLHRLPDHDAAKADPHAASDAVAQQQPIGQHLQRAREPAEENEMPPRDAVLGRSVSGIGVVMYVSSPSDQTPLPESGSLRPSALRSTCWSIWRGSYLPRRRWCRRLELSEQLRATAGLDGGRVGIDVADGVVACPDPCSRR